MFLQPTCSPKARSALVAVHIHADTIGRLRLGLRLRLRLGLRLGQRLGLWVICQWGKITLITHHESYYFCYIEKNFNFMSISDIMMGFRVFFYNLYKLNILL